MRNETDIIALSRSERAERAERLIHLGERALASPQLYRWRITAWIALGYGFIGVLLVAALVALIVQCVFVAIVLSAPYVEGGALKILAIGIALCLTVLVGLVRATLFVRFVEPDGLTLSQHDAPGLFAQIDDLCRAAHMRRPDEVVLSWDLNAGVVETPRFGLLPVFRRTLVVGLPLLEAVRPEGFRAVLAHEFGHLAGAHGQLSSFVYRIRQVWMRILAESHAGSARLGVVLSRFVAWYVPRLTDLTFPLARSNEFEADAFAARLTSADALCDSLVRLELIGAREREFWNHLSKQVLELPEPPQDVVERRHDFVSVASTVEDDSRTLDAIRRRPTQYDDTHPALGQRAAALGVTLKAPDRESKATAARELLQANYAQLASTLSARWARESARGWAIHRQEIDRMRARVGELRGRPGLTDDQRLELSVLMRRTGDTMTAHALIADLAERSDAPVVARILHAEALLETNPPAGVVAAEALLRESPVAAADAAMLLIEHFSEAGQWDRVEELRQIVEDGDAVHAAIERERETFDPAKDEALPHGLPDEVRARIAQVVQSEPRVVSALVFGKKLSLSTTPLVCIYLLLRQVTAGSPDNTRTLLDAVLRAAGPNLDVRVWGAVLPWPRRATDAIRAHPGTELVWAGKPCP